jgi:hypothetical protein
MAWERQRWGVIRCSALGAVLLVAALLSAQPVVAAGVVGTGRPGSCTEAALDAALAGGAMVTFDCGMSPVIITITSTKTIDADTTIDGGSLITISGGNSAGVFLVNPDVNFTVQSLTIANSGAGYGGGILNEGGTVTVTSSTFSGNSAGHFGGGILNAGTLTVANSTFSGNGAASGGGILNNIDSTLTVANSTFSDNGAAYSGGGIDNIGTLTVIDSTFSGNSAGIGGGGIANSGTLTVANSTFYDNSADGGFPVSRDGGGIANSGTLTVTNSTFSRNRALDRGGGIASSSGPVTITNTIIANSTSGGNCFYGVVTDGGHNIDDGTTCGFMGAGCTSTGGSSFCNTNPQLDPAGLADNGGPTQTIALLAGSPATNAGDESVCAKPPVNSLDQRGYLRPGIGHTVCSIGSYEADGVPPTGCVGPATGCLTAAKSVVVIKKDAEDDTQDKLDWKWLKGTETSLQELGAPTGATSYTLCLYAGRASATVALPAGSNWQTAGSKGFKYKDKSGTPNGAQKALLKSGAAGKAKALVKGKGANLPDSLVPPLSLPATVQLVNDTNSICFEAVYSAADVIKNDAGQFKAKAP